VQVVRLDRRWWVAIGVVVVVLVALVYSWVKRPPAECAPVQDLLAYNQQQSEQIGDGSGEGIPTVADVAAYRAWADGVTERANKVTDPNLLATSVQVAELAHRFVDQMDAVRVQVQTRAPGAPPPPAYFEMTAINDQLIAKLKELSSACGG